ncbi:STAS/SEC14 domain-containing protein [candidate division WOR-3 bacterium]|nr:STAS/SEC14 domain-containing protein [candidate division WOR-3 bacterium]
MKHELYFDAENRIVVFRTKGVFNYEEGVEAVEMLAKIVKGKENVLVLCDVSDFPGKLDRDVRRLQKDLPKRFNISKMAMVVTNPAIRMICKIVVATMGTDFSAGFFKTEQEAVGWLRGEEN